MKQIILLLSLSAILFACSKDDEPVIEAKSVYTVEFTADYEDGIESIPYSMQLSLLFFDLDNNSADVVFTNTNGFEVERASAGVATFRSDITDFKNMKYQTSKKVSSIGIILGSLPLELDDYPPLKMKMQIYSDNKLIDTQSFVISNGSSISKTFKYPKK